MKKPEQLLYAAKDVSSVINELVLRSSAEAAKSVGGGNVYKLRL